MSGTNSDLAGAMTDWRSQQIAQCRSARLPSNLLQVLPRALGTPTQQVQTPGQEPPALQVMPDAAVVPTPGQRQPTFEMIPGAAVVPQQQQPPAAQLIPDAAIVPPPGQSQPTFQIIPDAAVAPPQQPQPTVPTFQVIPGGAITPDAGAASGAGVPVDATSHINIPGLAMYLGHVPNNARNESELDRPHTPPPGTFYVRGGDLGASQGQGYSWYAMAEAAEAASPAVDVSVLASLPPGIVVALSHHPNIPENAISFFDEVAAQKAAGGGVVDGFVKKCGGDIGSDYSDQGYCWYESVKIGNTDWSLINELPMGTVVGLRHSVNNYYDNFVWEGFFRCTLKYEPDVIAECDARSPWIEPPNGFKRMFGGDIGAPEGQGYYWYQKDVFPNVFQTSVFNE